MWKEINGYEGRYEINENGDVKNSHTGHILKTNLRKGYKSVTLSNGCRGDYSKFSVHRLVALHFIDNPDNKPIVMHKDNNKLNCHVNNLEWGTSQENTINAHNDGLCPKQIYNVYKNNEDDVVCVGYKEVLSLIESKSQCKTVVTNAVRRKSTISTGPYKGYKIRKLTKGVIYE